MYRHLCIEKPWYPGDVYPIDVCIDMGIERCIDVCIDMGIERCIEAYLYTHFYTPSIHDFSTVMEIISVRDQCERSV